MAKSTCLKCGNHGFERVEITLEENDFEFIQCTYCGGVVGVVSSEHLQYIGDWFESISNSLEDISRQLRNIDNYARGYR